MEKEWIVPDTEQTKRMKKYAVSDVYSNGSDLYKLLSIKEMHSLVEKIKKGNIDASKLVFGRDTITLEERFLENVDRYITYIKDNFYFSSTEQLLTIEESLSNKYANILLCKDNVHSGKNQYNNIAKYTVGFIRMYLYNFYNNVLLFSKLYEDNIYTKMLNKELSKFDFDNDKDIFEIEKIFTKIVYIRRNNIYNCFISMSDVKEDKYDFYALQVEWCLADYYNLNWNTRFTFNQWDNYFVGENGSTILFNILNKEDDKYTIKFGVQNPSFSAKIDNFIMTENEFNKLLERFKKCFHSKKDKKESFEKIDFIDSAIKFDFWKDRSNYELVEIEFHFERSTEYFNVSLERDDIKRFINLLENAIKNI